MFNLLLKLIFYFKKPRVVIVVGENRHSAKEAISLVLNKCCGFLEKTFLFEADLKKAKELEKFKFLVKNSSLPVLVAVSTIGEKEEINKIRDLAKFIPSAGYLVLNRDGETTEEIKKEMNLNVLTFGFQEGADFLATDINLSEGTNFKINYKENTVPVWLGGTSGEERIYSALSAIAAGTIFDLNLVEISQALKSY